jgi:RimJ/RimL family protein N-acetyltransferase
VRLPQLLDSMHGCTLAPMDGQVALRPAGEDDLSWLASRRDGPAATGPHEWHGWNDLQRARRQWAESGLLGDDRGTLIVVNGTDRLGTITWRKVQTGPTAFNWAIGIGLAPEFRGRGYGSAAQRLLVRYLFAHTQANRIEATTEITNVAEQRALEKAGFTREGVLRGTTFRQGRWHDQVIYSVLRDEVELEDSGAEDGTARPAG